MTNWHEPKPHINLANRPADELLFLHERFIFCRYDFNLWMLILWCLFQELVTPGTLAFLCWSFLHSGSTWWRKSLTNSSPPMQMLFGGYGKSILNAILFGLPQLPFSICAGFPLNVHKSLFSHLFTVNPPLHCLVVGCSIIHIGSISLYFMHR